MLHNNPELFFTKNLKYVAWKRAKTLCYRVLDIGNPSVLTTTNQYNILTYIANSTSKQKEVAKELLLEYKDILCNVEIVEPVPIPASVVLFAHRNKVNVDDLYTRYKIILRDMQEKNLSPYAKIKLYRFSETIRLALIVIDIFKYDGTPITGEKLKPDPVYVPPVKLKRKYTKKAKPTEVAND